VSPRAATKVDLSRDVVVERALEISDVEGIEAVTIRRLASEFGVTPMALYWHVKNKEELLDAMGDRIFEGFGAAAVSTTGPWHQQLRIIMATLIEALRVHPGALRVAARRVLSCEDGLIATEHTLKVLREAGFAVQSAADIARNLLQISTVMVEGNEGQYFTDTEEEREGLIQAKRAGIALLPIDRFPHVVEAADALTDCDDPEAYYGQGIDLFIAGVKALQPKATERAR